MPQFPTPRRTALAMLMMLASANASSADRYWSFGPGCASADLSSFCWRASSGGAAGVSPPRAGDRVFIQQNAATELTVRAINVVNGVLPSYQSLVLDGSGAAPAGLLLERGTLSAVSAVVGDGGRGHLTQTGGLAVLDGLTLGYSGYGRVDLQGGELRTQGLAVGLGGTGDLVQTAGLLSVTGTLGVSPGSTLRSDGGTLDLRGVNAFSQYANGQWGTVHLAGGTVLTNAGQTLRAGKLLATAGSGEMLRNTVLEVGDLVLSGVGRTVEFDARVRNSGYTTVLASAANDQVTVNLRGQGSLLGAVVVGTDANGFGAGRGVLQVLAGGQAGADALFAGNREGGVGQVRVSGAGSSLAVTGAMEIGVVNAWDQPFSLLTVDQGGQLEARTLKLQDNGAAQVMSGGRIAVGDSLILFTQSNRQPSLLVSGGGMVSAGTTLLNTGTSLGLTGPSSTLATGVLTNNGTTFLAGVGARITGAGGLGTPLTVTNAGLLDVREAAVAGVAGAVQNQGSGTVNVGAGASLRMDSYAGAGRLNIGPGASLTTDGPASIEALGYVGLVGSVWKVSTIVNHGTLELTGAALLPADGGAFNLLDNRGTVSVHERVRLDGYTGSGLLTMRPFSASLDFVGPVLRVRGSQIDAGVSYSQDPKVIYRGPTVFDVRDADIQDSARIGFAETAVVTMAVGPGGVGGTAHQLVADYGLIVGGQLQLDFGAGGPPGPGETAPQLRPGLTLDLFDTPFGSLSGSFTSVSLLNATLAPGAALDLSSLSTDGIVRVVAAPVPEPGTWALWLAGLAGLGWRQARQRAGRRGPGQPIRRNPRP